MRYDSPVKKFPGYIVLPEFLTMPQVMAFEAALGDLDAIAAAARDETNQARIWLTPSDETTLKVALLAVSEWHIEGVPEAPTAETFPFSPRKASHDLIDWVFGLVRDLWIGERELPNA